MDAMAAALPAGWRRVTVPAAGGGADVLLADGAPGRPPSALLAAPILRGGADGWRISITFQLRAVPRPTDRLGELVDRAVLALEADLVPGDAVLAALGGLEPGGLEPGGLEPGGLEPGGLEPGGLDASARPQLVERVAFELTSGAGAALLSSGELTGPFARGALAGTLERAAAMDLLAAVTGDQCPLELAARVVLPAAPVGKPTRVRVALGWLWTTLDGVADTTRVFREADLRNYLPALLSSGAIAVQSGDGTPNEVLPAVLRAARYVLRPAGDLAAELAGDGLGAPYRLVPSSPGNTDSVADAPPVDSAGVTVAVRARLADVLAPALEGGLERILHFVTSDGGRMDPLLPARRVARTRGGRANRLAGAHLATHDGRLVSVATALRPSSSPLAEPLLLQRPPMALDRPHLMRLDDLELVLDQTDRRPGPVVDDAEAAMWPDRWDTGTAWYAPAFELELPDPGSPPEASPFRFDVVADGGHTADGSAGITATINVRLRSVQSAATRSAWEAAGRPTLRAVALGAPTVQLAIPFRDENGVTRVESIPAESVQVSGDLAADGRVTATFRLLDRWARLAYGVLSTPDFQTWQAAVTVATTFAGWRRSHRRPVLLGLRKRWALSGSATRDEAGAARPHAAVLSQPALAHAAVLHATVLPAWRIDAAVEASLARGRLRVEQLRLRCFGHGVRVLRRAWGGLPGEAGRRVAVAGLPAGAAARPDRVPHL